jgi:cell division protein FtsZ
MFELEESYNPQATIKVVGVGGAGGNAINRMIQSGVKGVEFLALNTDLQVLSKNLAPIKIQIGAQLTQGKGTGADPEVGRRAALESQEAISEALRGADMVFIAAGMGKGTGTGSAPVVAEIALSLGILTLPVVTMPFTFEGPVVRQRADGGLEALAKVVESMLVIPNDRLSQMHAKISVMNAYTLADETLRHAVQSIADIITQEGVVNVDFNDVCTVMRRKGGSYMGVGVASGEGAAQRAAGQALSNPYLENVNIQGATGALINITAREEDLCTTEDLSTVLKMVGGVVDPGVDLLYGIGTNPEQGDDLKVTVIATGFTRKGQEPSNPLNVMGDIASPRSSRGPAPSPAQGFLGAVDITGSSEDLEIPAFIRKQMARAK